MVFSIAMGRIVAMFSFLTILSVFSSSINVCVRYMTSTFGAYVCANGDSLGKTMLFSPILVYSLCTLLHNWLSLSHIFTM